MLADIFESFIAALFLDGGWVAVNEVIGNIMKPFLHYFIKFFNNFRFFDKIESDLDAILKPFLPI